MFTEFQDLTPLQIGIVIFDLICITMFFYYYVRAWIHIVKDLKG